MDAKVFDSGDEPFFEWMSNHSGGYVLNTKRNPATTYATLHRSLCRHLVKYGPGHSSPDGFTEQQYIKVCAEEAKPLVEWMRQNRPKALEEWMRETQPSEERNAKPCGSCLPDVEIMGVGLHQHPEEESEPEAQEEGSTVTVEVNRYERSKPLRQACLEHYGAECQVCGLRFEERYGEIGESFIEVHHEVPLSETDGDVEVDPIEDLKPVCPNCHAMLHQKSPPIAVEDLKERLHPEG